MAQTLADIAPDDIVWDDSATVQPPTNNDWLTSAPRVALYDVDPADIDWWDMGRWRDRTLMESAQKTIGEAGNAVTRGLAMSRLASEMEQPEPDPAKIIQIQREIAQNPPSAEFQTVMNDNASPQESWSAFTRNPIGVVNELMLDSLSSYASQMFEKAPARVAIGTGAGAAIGSAAFGVGAIPAGATGALAGFAQSGGASSYSLEMAGGILESLEQAGVNMGSPEELGAALQDEQRMQVAREFAQKKAIPVAAFDTVSALIAGRVMGAKPATVLQKLGKGMVETAVQSVLGMSGEATGQLSQSGEITSVRQIGAEGIGEIAPGMIEVGVGTGVQAMQGQQPAVTAPASAPAAAAPALFTPPPAAETVVVEEVFGDPTTAAAEPVAATESTAASVPMMITRQMEASLLARGFSQADINAMTPQQANDILAGQEPASPIVTEPPAATTATKIYRGRAPDIDYTNKDEFWSDSAEVAENYAGQTGKEGAIDEADASVLPQNLYSTPDKPTLKEDLGLQAEPFAPEFDAEAKAALQAQGFGGIRYESGTDLGGEQATEFHVFGKAQQAVAPAPAAAPFTLPRELSRSAPRYGMATLSFDSDFDRAAYVLANDAVKPSKAAPKFRAALEAAGFDIPAVVAHGNKVKAAIKQEAGGGAAPQTEVGLRIAQQPFAGQTAAAAPAQQAPPMPVQEAPIARGNARKQSRSNQIAQDVDNQQQGQSVNTPNLTVAPSREAAGQMARDMVMDDPSLPPAPPATLDVLRAITNRANRRGYDPSVITEEAIKSAKKSGYITKSQNPKLTEDGHARLSEWEGMARERWLALSSLQDNLADQAVSEWDAANDPTSASAIEARQQQDTPAKKSRARIKKMTAQSGAIDLSIVEDLVEYGKTVYRAGMSFGKWAGQMVKEFGQGIASFLKQAFDRIVQAYKDSPYSDTTGAVGDVRPKAKPRQFEQRVSQAENVSEETRRMLGDDMYDPIGLEPMAEEAQAWIAQNGIEAAERLVLTLGNNTASATPLDFAIAQYLQVNLDAMGFHNRAATVARIISRKATSLGQTISVLKMFSRLSPEGIVQYANQIMDEHIEAMPPERQAQIRADQQSMVELEEAIATTRKRTAEDAIIKGEQGGEKIQDKLKRRVPDKGQKQNVNVNIRSVLTSQATKAEATKQITQLLVESGISASEAAALANAVTSRFYAVLEGARKSAAQASRPKSGKGKVAFDKLMTRLKNGEVSDQELLAELARMRGLPALTLAIRNRLQKLAQEVRTATDEDVRVVAATLMFEEVHELVPADFWSKVRTFRIIMMLFSPKTWIKNLGGNQVQWFLHIGRDSFINSVVDPIVSGFSGKRTAARAKTGRVRALLTPLSDLKKGYMWNKQNNPQASFAENRDAALNHLRVLSKLTTQNKFEMADIKDVGRRMFSDPFMGFLEAALSIALGGPDRAYWMSAFRASLAQREAAAKANGEWTGRPSPEDVEGAQADAMASIYQNKNSISELGIAVRSKVNFFSTKAVAKLVPGMTPTTQYGLGSMLLTFAQVPGAIARAAINWSPLGLVNAFYEGMNGILWKTSKQRFGKPFDQAAFNKAFTEALGGSGIYVAGYWLYAMGIITASQEEDEDLEAMRKAMGMGQFSINMSALKRMLLSANIWEKQQTQFGDAIYKYDWVQPVAITFAAGAELAKMVEENNRNGIRKGLAGKVGMAALSLAAGAKSLEELPLLSGLSSFLKTWGNDSLLSAVTKTVAGEPSAFVPQLVRQANQLMDNTLRQTRGGDSDVLRAFNQLAANTPGVGDKYPPRFDITGTPMERYHRSGNTIVNVLINPAVAAYAKTHPVFDEVQRLMSATGETQQFPREVKRAAKINGQNVQLSNEQLSAYQYYVGNYTMSTFNWRINNPNYLKLPDTMKVKELAQDMEDIDAAVKSALFGHDVRRLTRRQRVMRANLVNSPLGQSMPPR